MQILTESETQGYIFATDQDSALSATAWQGTKWDSGISPITALNESLITRNIALQHLGLHSLHNDSAISTILSLLPVVYLWHRYEVEAVVKLIGGVAVNYALRNDKYNRESVIVSGIMQRQALRQVNTVICMFADLRICFKHSLFTQLQHSY